MNTFKVWIQVEEVNEDGDQVGEDILLPFASVATFGTQEDAVGFATALQNTNGRVLPTNQRLRACLKLCVARLSEYGDAQGGSALVESRRLLAEG